MPQISRFPMPGFIKRMVTPDREKQAGQFPYDLPPFISVGTSPLFGTQKEAGQLNSALYATVSWVSKRLVSCPLRIMGAEDQEVENHFLERVLKNPAPGWSGAQLVEAMVRDLLISGNGYALLERVATGVRTITWLPAERVSVNGNDMALSYTFQQHEGSPRVYLPQEILHLKMDPNPNKPSLGLSPLYHLLTETNTDDELLSLSRASLRIEGLLGQ